MTLLRCPSCGGEMSLDVLLSHNDLRQAMVDLVEKGLAVGSLALRYVGLFRPATNRMSADRFSKLVLQLSPDLQRGAITFRGRDWFVPREMWEQGFEAMLEKAAASKLVLPLENHNYLYAVLAALADKKEAVQEEAVEQSRRIQAAPVPAAPVPAAPVPLAEIVTRSPGMPAHIREHAERIRQQARESGLEGSNA